jgi:hypothetical protein
VSEELDCPPLHQSAAASKGAAIPARLAARLPFRLPTRFFLDTRARAGQEAQFMANRCVK